MDLPWEIIGCMLAFVLFATLMVWAGSWLDRQFGESMWAGDED
jgi:hypothetical protein